MWTDLDVRHLLALRAVAEEGTFGKAAGRLGFTQSAVSHQVAALEKLVGIAVFDRPAGPRRPVLTPAGELLLKHAHDVLGIVEQAETDIDRLKRGISGTLVIGAMQSIATTVLPVAIGLLRSECPDVEIRLVEDDPHGDSGQSVLTGDLDLSFVVGEPEPGLSSVHLGVDPYVLLEPAGSSDFDDGPVAPRWLSGRPTVGLPEADGCQRLVSEELERRGASPDYVFRSVDNGAVQGMVRAGMGVAIMPLLAIDPSDPGIRLRELSPPIPPRNLSIVWDPSRTRIPAAARFVEIVKNVSAERLDPSGR